jgi:hypothetical protein
MTTGLTAGTAVALVSAKGSPGVTTSAILLAAVWPSGATLLEADPVGGDLRTLFSDPTGQPLRPDRGVVSLLTAQPPTISPAKVGPALHGHSQHLSGGLPVVLGPANASQVEALRPPWLQLASLIRAHVQGGANLVVDAGRLGDPSSLALTLPLLRSCTTTLVVARATLTSVSHARDLLGLLRDVALPAELLLIADPRDTADVTQATHLAANQLHVLPDDATSAAALIGPWTRRLDRSRLLAAARTVVSTLYQRHTAAGEASRAQEQFVELTASGAVPA